MDENKLNNLSKKLFENVEFEKAPKDFTDKLMLKVEMAKNAKTVKSGPFLKYKFMIIFILTFGIITILSLAFRGTTTQRGDLGLKETQHIPTIDFGFFSKYLDINYDFSFIAKLVVGSVILLIFIDLISGTLIDKFIDSKARKENKV
jgi:hypothetical protein